MLVFVCTQIDLIVGYMLIGEPSFVSNAVPVVRYLNNNNNNNSQLTMTRAVVKVIHLRN